MKSASIKILAIISSVYASLPLLAQAQLVTTGTTPPPITTVQQVYNLTTRVLGYLQSFFWVIAAIMIVWAAFLYVTAGGNEDKVSTAKKMILYAFLAIVVALIATAVVGAVRAFIGTGGPTGP